MYVVGCRPTIPARCLQQEYTALTVRCPAQAVTARGDLVSEERQARAADRPKAISEARIHADAQLDECGAFD